MKKFTPLGSSLDELAKKIPNLDHLPDEDPDAKTCPYCDGYGHIISEDGKARPCSCVRKEIIQTGIQEARIPQRYREVSLATFETPNSFLRSNLALATEYVQNYSLKQLRGLYIYGPTGSGKTHLAIGILKGLIERGFDGVFFNVVDLLDSIRATFDPNASLAPKDRLMQDLERQILVLDDFGVQKTSTWVVDRLYSLINRRYQDCKTIIITSNIKATDLFMQVERRLVSRIVEMCQEIEIKAEDYRQRATKPSGGRGRSSQLR